MIPGGHSKLMKSISAAGGLSFFHFLLESENYKNNPGNPVNPV
jgi:hypothetical protein